MAESQNNQVKYKPTNLEIEASKLSAIHKKALSDDMLGQALARKVDSISSEIVLTMPYQKSDKIGDSLLRLLLVLIKAARKLGIKAFKWFNRVNKEQFSNVIIMWATILQKKLVQKSRENSRWPSTKYMKDGGPNPRNLAMVYHTIDFIGTCDSWRLDNLLKTLNAILSSSQQSQRILRYMSSASPHIHDGSWVMMMKSRSALKRKSNRTFSDVKESMNLTPEMLDHVVKDYATKSLLDLYQTENAAEYRKLLNNIERWHLVSRCLPNQYKTYGSKYNKVNLFHLSRGKRTLVVEATRKFWDLSTVTKMQMWMDQGVEPIELVRGLLHFSTLGMYPCERLVDAFLQAARNTCAGIDGDDEIGQMVQQIRGRRRRKSVSVLEYFLLDGISAKNLYILGPTLSRENNELVQSKFNKLWKIGYGYQKITNYRSLLQYGFKVNVGRLTIKNQLKKDLKGFINRKNPREVKERAVFLYYCLKMTCNMSELPITVIFLYAGISEHILFARNRLESKRLKAENFCRSCKRKSEFQIDKGRHKRQRTGFKSLEVYQMASATKVELDLRSSL